MLRHKNIDRVCCIVLAMTLLISSLFVGAAATGLVTEDNLIGYENRLFDQSRVHTIDIVMDDWDSFVSTATSEEYSACHLVIDGESYKNVAIRGKGNTSLSSVQAYGNNRYSFKVEFDHYQSGATYHGLDKLSLNNLIQDNTYMKDYFAYTLMNKMGVAAPMCSFVQVNVNGAPWGLYLAVEGVEDSFLQRNYGKDHGELYKPDSMSFGGGRGNGAGFDMEALMENFGISADETGEDAAGGFTMPKGFQLPEGFDPSQMMESFGGSSGQSTSTATPQATATPEPTPAMTEETADADSSGVSSGDPAAGSSGMPAGGEMPDTSSLPEGADPSQMTGSFGGSSGEGTTAAPAGTAAPESTPAPTMGAGSNGASSGMPAGTTMPDGYNPAQGMGSSGESAGTSAATIAPTATTIPAIDMPHADASAMPDGMPSNFDPSQMHREGAERSGRADRFSKEGLGGGFSMGSSDVKLQYADDDPSSYANIFNNAKTDITAADQTRLIASLKALGEGDVSVIDTDAVIRYMVVHNFLCNDDSYTGTIIHNYYLYEEDGVLAMIPWDYNLAYGTMTGSNATSSVNADIDTLVTGGSDTDRPMASWIASSEEYMAQYHAIYQEFMTNVFDSGWFAEEIDRVIAMISPYVEADPTAFCTYEDFTTGAETLKQFCLKRAESVSNQLAGDDTRVDASDLTLSDMGTMGNMGGRGGESFAERFRGFAAYGEVSTDNTPPPDGGGETAPDPGEDAFDFSSFDFGSSGGSSASEATPSAAPAAEDTPPGDAPLGEAAAAVSARPVFNDDFNMRGMADGAESSSTVAWLIICVLLLGAALILAKVYPTNR